MCRHSLFNNGGLQMCHNKNGSISIFHRDIYPTPLIFLKYVYVIFLSSIKIMYNFLYIRDFTENKALRFSQNWSKKVNNPCYLGLSYVSCGFTPGLRVRKFKTNGGYIFQLLPNIILIRIVLH